MKMVHTMNYKLIIYSISMIISAFAISSLDLNKIFKKNKIAEAYAFAILLIIALAGLVSSFIINFLEVSHIS